MGTRYWIFITILLLPGCGSPASGELGRQDGIVPGKVYEDIKCRQHPGFSYSIYIPSNYIPGDSLPVFIAFDPGGAGSKPVSLYMDLAERFGFILAGSNNSRNGQGTEITGQILFALLTEIENRYSVNPDRIYCTGFSGGSRVSSMIAFYRGGIKGVICCGAGLPATSVPFRYNTDYYGIVGDQDFNYMEMITLSGQLKNLGLRNNFRIFHGAHVWPPPEDFEAGIRWHWLNAIHDGMEPADPALQEEVLDDIQKDLAKVHSIGINELEEEKKLQQFYSECLKTKPVSWWRREKNKLDHPADTADNLANKRMIGYISIIAYTYSNQALAAKDKNELARMIGIYETVDPENTYISRLKEQLNTLP